LCGILLAQEAVQPSTNVIKIAADVSIAAQQFNL